MLTPLLEAVDMSLFVLLLRYDHDANTPHTCSFKERCEHVTAARKTLLA